MVYFEDLFVSKTFMYIHEVLSSSVLLNVNF